MPAQKYETSKIPLPIRLAILECDTPVPKANEKYGSYGDIFVLLLRAGAKSLGRPKFETDMKITKHQVELEPDSYPELHDIDAILMTGSRHDSFADTPWINKLVEYTRKAVETDRIRIIGVCFGHQIIARALDAKVGRNPDGWEVAVNNMELTSRGKEIFGVEKLALHQMHRDIVFNYPSGAEALGHSPVCSIQGMYIPQKYISVQGHPEFNQEIMSEIIETRHKTGIFDDEAYEKYIKRTSQHHDGVIVSEAFLRFLLDE